ncbi:hypothetical protein GTW78_00740 [Streptomyces sp. SID4948]|nr:hypothetical protein [Streptomyces sp. SID4948]
MMGQPSRPASGNRYDDRMVLFDVSDTAPGTVLVARLHVDLCRRTAAASTRA